MPLHVLYDRAPRGRSRRQCLRRVETLRTRSRGRELNRERTGEDAESRLEEIQTWHEAEPLQRLRDETPHFAVIGMTRRPVPRIEGHDHLRLERFDVPGENRRHVRRVAG